MSNDVVCDVSCNVIRSMLAAMRDDDVGRDACYNVSCDDVCYNVSCDACYDDQSWFALLFVTMLVAL